jgi:hypothetical protein
MTLFTLQDLFISADATKKRNERGCSGHLCYIKFLFSFEKIRGLDIERQLNYKLQELNLLLPPSMHLQWLKTNATIALIDVNPVTRTCHMLAQTTTREQMSDNDAI